MRLMLSTHSTAQAACRAALLFLGCCVLVACGDDDDTVDAGGTVRPDAEVDTGVIEDPDYDDAEVDELDAGVECTTDESCADTNACDGLDSCVNGRCVAGRPLRCSAEHPCIPGIGCECSDPDSDNDNFDAQECLPPGIEGDCNDRDNAIFPGAHEICREGGDGTDEDCDPTTFSNPDTGDGDLDRDGVINARCYNLDEHGNRFGGEDCDDKNYDSHPDAGEICDTGDNDCDGFVDEGSKDGGLVEPYGLQEPFYPDSDHDGSGNPDGGTTLGCESDPPAGRVPAYLPIDCDDTNDDRNKFETELCDGVDNDCDGLVDMADDNEQPLSKPIEFDETLVACREPEGGGQPRWFIDDCPGEPGDPDEKLWCTDIVDYGCETDGTTIKDCRVCGNTCHFACGKTDCDEIVNLALGEHHSCATTREGTAACWGRGAGGRLGNDITRSRPTASPVFAIEGATQIAAGADFSCAVAGATNALFCWGSNAYGQLANGDSDDLFNGVPLPVPSPYDDELYIAQVDEVAVSAHFGCVVVRGGTLLCWGENTYGQLANADPGTYPEPQLPGVTYDADYNEIGNASKVSVGVQHGCIITSEHELQCWGSNENGQLGNREVLTISELALAVPGIGPVSAVAVGSWHTCALSSGEVYCWGLNDALQLGHQSDESDDVPTLVGGLPEISALDAGEDFTCALGVDQHVYCWGGNTKGQRGDLDTAPSAAPTMVDIDEVTKIAVGAIHACALDTADRVFCWGGNVYGELGIGRTFQAVQAIPLPIAPLD